MMNQQKESLWQYISIKANSTEFYLDAVTDSLNVKNVDTSKQHKSYKLLKSDKDSLFSWTESIIDKKANPSVFCTDYVGKLTLRIVYSEQMSKQISYRSICEWKNLDSNTSKIYELLSKIEHSN